MAEPPVEFERGMPLTAARLNRLQRLILEALRDHDHSGGAQAGPLGPGGLAAGAVTGPKLADGAVEGRALAGEAVDDRVLAAGAVTARALAGGAVGTDALAGGAVSEEKLSDGVLRLIRARSDQVSSASQVIWRDPLEVLRPVIDQPAVGILETFVRPELVYWEPSVVALDVEGRPVKLIPELGGARLDVVELVHDDPRTGALYRELDTRVVRAAEEIGALGAVRINPRTAGIATGAGLHPAAGRDMAEPVAGVGAMAPNMAMMAMTAAPPAAADPGAPVALTDAGTQVAHRMTAVVSLDDSGRGTSFSTEAASFTPAFGGKESFLEPGESVSYTSLQTTAQKARAAGGLSRTLYNLGLDEEYLEAAGETETLRAALMQALEGNVAFFGADNPLWTPGGWLPEILERPHMFGTGYALSGGRNVLDVTRQRDQPTGARWVRVRFVTPYRNAAYAVTVTPAQREDFALICPMIRAKRRDSVDIVFRALPAAGGPVTTLDKVSFDLAVFGELEKA
ncbi:hypothetical protein [Rhodobaculum claviforme]|uniref:Uncharacterized protein n=1 Tax=Rhodobaculum claviforme TaxID=1549854 RepID=A0A934TGC6_9RHOB|nr:hypothetical protein [Rhodobaculum claviforme]MBK5925792.1 hypothetical protein [Rhodobaculum claviforme]